jgi:hypothetical protein
MVYLSRRMGSRSVMDRGIASLELLLFLKDINRSHLDWIHGHAVCVCPSSLCA